VNLLKVFVAVVAAALVVALCAASGAWTQTWPTGPIRIVVGYAPGGSSDISARVVGEALSQALGQPVLVENRPGAQGGIALDTVTRARPDGYTLLVSPAEALYQRALEDKGPFDVAKTLAPITVLTSQPLVIAANPRTRWTSIADMIAAAKANPASVSFATPSSGGTNVIVGELMFRRAGVKVLNVPYKGGGQAVQDVLSGVVPVGVLGAGPIMPYAQSGRLGLLAVTSKDRSSMLPSVPTMAEAGYPEIAITQWFAAFAPAGTPSDIVERLAAAYGKALADPTVRDRLAAAALETVGGTPEAFSRRLAAEGEAWLRRAREFGLDRN
jgi:tripartite-type tricarboxylate transporter receptor subunit TctC